MTAEYAMLPASTGERKARDISRGKQDGRGVEIQRLIGRSLRVVVDFEALGRTQRLRRLRRAEADGGTRCAAITGGYVALRLALQKLVDAKAIEAMPLTGSVAAVSVGMVDGRALCDLDYSEDSSAEVDANVVMTGDGGLVEVQATAERTPLSRASLDELLGLAEGGIARLRQVQEQVSGSLIFATGNKHKLREMRELLPGVELEPLPDGVELPPEDGDCLRRDRAGEGARGASRRPAGPASPTTPGSSAVGLGGRPGIHSARYGGEGATDEENLDEAAARGRRGRRRVAGPSTPARWRWSRRTAPSTSSKARCEGRLIEEPRGEGGFGYDPAFVPDDTGPTSGRCRSSADAEKNEISHRGRAARMLAAHLAGGAPARTRAMIRTKSGAAALSIASNAPLIAIKLAAGAITGSIAIITEALHSLIDLVASVVAFISVRKADEPADADHPYGHEKVESLAATIEGMLILVGAGIIVYEATHRLVVGSEVETLGVGIAVMGFSVLANLAVSTVLSQTGAGARIAGARGRRRPSPHRRPHLGGRAGRAGAGRGHRRRRLRLDNGPDRRGGDRRRRAPDHPALLGGPRRRSAARRGDGPDRGGDRRGPDRGGRRVPQAARAPRRAAPLHRPPRPVPVGDQPRARP